MLCIYIGTAKVQQCANLPDAQKTVAVKEMEEHLLKVTKRYYLRFILKETKKQLPPDLILKEHVANS